MEEEEKEEEKSSSGRGGNHLREYEDTYTREEILRSRGHSPNKQAGLKFDEV